MKNLKSIVALLLMVCMLFSLSGCHKKGEVALGAEGYNITAGMYSYYLTVTDAVTALVTQTFSGITASFGD